MGEKHVKHPANRGPRYLLAHGPNFAEVPKCLPIVEYIATVEQGCQQLKQGEAEELWAEVKAVLKKAQPQSNISKEEQKAMKELRNDNTRVILTADKGVSIVVMDRDEYIKKAEEILNQSTYKTIPTDPTTNCKNRLIPLLKNIKAEGGINNTTYRRMYPTGAESPKFYGLQNVHKEGVPLRP